MKRLKEILYVFHVTTSNPKLKKYSTAKPISVVFFCLFYDWCVVEREGLVVATCLVTVRTPKSLKLHKLLTLVFLYHFFFN